MLYEVDDGRQTPMTFSSVIPLHASHALSEPDSVDRLEPGSSKLWRSTLTYEVYPTLQDARLVDRFGELP